MRRGLRILVLVGVLSSPGAKADAQDWNRVIVRSGVLVADVNSDIRSDPRAGPGTGIDLESDLGLTHGATVFFVEGTWRIARRHQLHGGYLATSRAISGVI